VAVTSGCDPSFGFEDLGNAVRKIAIDLGVYIAFGKLRALKTRSKDNSVIEGAYYAVGVIDYKSAPEWNSGTQAGAAAQPENGYILYVKPGYHGTESAGIVAYATANATFPHETTGDQFFSESQFESYRTLGFEIMDSVLKEAAKNVELINYSKTWEASPGSICHLIKALDPTVLKKAEEELPPRRPKVASMLKLLDDTDLDEMRSILAKTK